MSCIYFTLQLERAGKWVAISEPSEDQAEILTKQDDWLRSYPSDSVRVIQTNCKQLSKTKSCCGG